MNFSLVQSVSIKLFCLKAGGFELNHRVDAIVVLTLLEIGPNVLSDQMNFASMMNFQVDSRCFADVARFVNVQVVVNADTDENGWQYAFVHILAGCSYGVLSWSL